MLRYKDGDACEKYPGFKKSTQIVFRCAKLPLVGRPVLVMNDNDCTYTFEWETTAACSNEDEEVECLAHDDTTGKMYDLSRLTKTTGNWEVFFLLCFPHVFYTTMVFHLNVLYY
jgi:hypothetical protein